MKSTLLLTTAAMLAIAGAAAAQTPAPSAKPAAAPPAASGAPRNYASSPAPVAAKGDIIQTAQAAGQFTTFLKVLDATNLTMVLKQNSNLTVFAPTDAAFAALPPGELDRLMADKPSLQKLLTHHVINARVDSSKLKGARGEVTTVAGDKVLLDGSGATITADNADVLQADVMATNGIIYVVDAVLQPGTGAAASAGASGAAASTSAPEGQSSSTAPTAPAKTSQAPASGAAAPKGK
jgi:uncharacterized surface protein with fasciclin (FAS1) repeats